MKKLLNIIQSSTHKSESPLEKMVIDELILYDIPFETQFKVSSFRIDIAFPQFMLGLEVDGHKYHSTPKQIAQDEMRQKYLEHKGWKIERVPGWFCYRNPDLAALKIVRFIPGIEESELFQEKKRKMIMYHAKEMDNEGNHDYAERILKRLTKN